MTPLSTSFYARPALHVAPDLLGCLLVRKFRSTTVVGRIVEVEAYREDDPASHSFRGRTARNEVMFGPPGHLYVYFTYGMHYCGNVVTGAEGRGEAVLLRAVEPIMGLEHMTRRRYGVRRVPSGSRLRDLVRGPARLCQAFHITAPDNGTSLLSGAIRIVRGDTLPAYRIHRSQRIGIRSGMEQLWRFSVKESIWVSGGKPASR